MHSRDSWTEHDQPSTSSSSESNSDMLESSSELPARGRARGRYPSELSKSVNGLPGRVPLHRRGKSKQYEPLEDLLREAGYKETRVFTPEQEALEARQGSLKGGVDAVVGFLQGLMRSHSGASGGCIENESGKDENYDTDWSEVADQVSPTQTFDRAHYLDGARRPLSRKNSRSSLASSYGGGGGQQVLYHRPSINILNSPPPSAPVSQLDFLRSQLPDTGSRPSRRPSRPSPSSHSQAHAILKNMASVPDIGQPGRAKRSHRRQSSASHAYHEPLPSTWLETVAKAVLGMSGSGAHIGGPSGISSVKRRPSAMVHALSDHTNHAHLAPPQSLFLQRAHTAPGEVSTTRVVCRSAPASRSTSSSRNQSVKRSNSFGKRKRSQAAGEDVHPPLLADTKVEGDVWSDGGVLRGQEGRYVRGWGSGIGDEDELCEESDEEEGEIDLARMLVNPKRQQSIKSLRKHLHQNLDSSGSSRNKDSLRTASRPISWVVEGEVVGDGGWRGDGEEGLGDWNGVVNAASTSTRSGRSTSKRRRGLPWQGGR